MKGDHLRICDLYLVVSHLSSPHCCSHSVGWNEVQRLLKRKSSNRTLYLYDIYLKLQVDEVS